MNRLKFLVSVLVVIVGLLIVGLSIYVARGNELFNTASSSLADTSSHVTIRTNNVESLHLKEGKLYLFENDEELLVDITSRYISELLIAPEKDKFAFVTGHELYEYTLAGGKIDSYSQPDACRINSLLYSPNGKYLAFSCDAKLNVLDSVNKLIYELDGSNSLQATEWHSNAQFMSVSTVSDVYKVFALNAEGKFDNVFY